MCDAIDDLDNVQLFLPCEQDIEPEQPSTCYKIFQSVIATLVLPSLTISKSHLNERRLLVLQNDRCRPIKVPMEGKIVLDGIHMRHPEGKNPGQVMVVFWGAMGCYEGEIAHERALALQKEFEVDLVLVNYAGVGASGGYTSSPEMIDSYSRAVIDWTVKEFPGRSLVLYASSLGAYAGIEALHYALAKKAISQNKILLIADKTFSRMRESIQHIMPPTWFARFVMDLPYMRPFLQKVNQSAGWAIDNLASLKRIHYAGFSPTIIIANHEKDMIIASQASLSSAVNNWRRIEGVETPNTVTLQLEDREISAIEETVHLSWFSGYRDTVEKCKEIIRHTFEEEERNSA